MKLAKYIMKKIKRMAMNALFMFVSENSCSKDFVNFRERHHCESCRLPNFYWECPPEKFMKFSKHIKHQQMAASAISCY